MISNFREMIHAKGWGQFGEPVTYSPDPIDVPAPQTPGVSVALAPDALDNADDQLIADSFKLVATCLLNDDDEGSYAGLLRALLGAA